MNDHSIDLEPYLKKAKQHTNKRIFGIFLFGSQNYGLADEYSDIDVRCLVFPNNKDSAILRTEEVVLPNEERIEYMDIRLYFQALCQGNLTILETLYTNFYIVDSSFDKEWRDLKAMIDELAYLSPEQFYTDIQYLAEECVVRYFLDLGHPELTKKCGYAAKNIYHLLRFQDIVERYKQKESFNTIFKVSNPKELRDIKRGRWSKALANSCIKQMITYFNFEKTSTDIRETPEYQKAWKIILSIYKKAGWDYE